MAKIVLAGRSDCPFYAKCERIGDQLSKNLHKFKLHKIIVQPDKWEEWLQNTCAERGWTFAKSPMIWRELIDRGGKGVLIGDHIDFQEYAKAYYDVETNMMSEQMKRIAAENKATKNITDKEEAAYKAMSDPIHICITNGGSLVCYHLLNSISSGKIFSHNTEITIHLLVTIPKDIEKVKGFAMEAEDIAHGVLKSVIVSSNPFLAFENCSVIILLESLLKQSSETERMWLERNREYFSRYGFIINEMALKSCKVLVCGDGPVNANAAIIAKNASDLKRQNIVALPTVLENRAKAVIGEKLGVNPADVANLVVWGNINLKRYLDLNHCAIYRYKGAIRGPSWHSKKCTDLIPSSFIKNTFPKLASTIHARVSQAMGSHTSLSSAAAIFATLQYWLNGNPDNRIYSLVVCSEGWYEVPYGMYFSFPVRFNPKGSWSVMTDLNITKETKKAINASIAEIKPRLRLFGIELRPQVSDKLAGSTNVSRSTSAKTENEQQASMEALMKAVRNS